MATCGNLRGAAACSRSNDRNSPTAESRCRGNAQLIPKGVPVEGVDARVERNLLAINDPPVAAIRRAHWEHGMDWSGEVAHSPSAHRRRVRATFAFPPGLLET